MCISSKTHVWDHSASEFESWIIDPLVLFRVLEPQFRISFMVSINLEIIEIYRVQVS